MSTTPPSSSDDTTASQDGEDAQVANTNAVESDGIVSVTETEVRVHRSPRYARFMLVGGILFAIVAFVLTYSTPADAQYSQSAVLGFTLAICVTVGVTLGALTALLADRIARRGGSTLRADRIDVRPGEGDDDLSAPSQDS